MNALLKLKTADFLHLLGGDNKHKCAFITPEFGPYPKKLPSTTKHEGTVEKPRGEKTD